MKYSLAANAAQARQTKERFAQPEEQLSYELGKAVQELPPLYTRLLAGTISIVIFGAISWAHFSEIDEVATAPGELIASTQVRPVTSLGDGSILAVKVKEGDRVTKDQILIERDPNLQQTDVNRLAKASKLIEEDLQRLQAERTGGKTAGTKLQDELLNSRLSDYKAKQAAAEAEAQRQLSIINQAKVRLTRLQENLASAQTSVINAQTNIVNAENIRLKVENNLSIAQQREKNLSTLLNPGAVPRIDYLEAQERLNRANTEIIRSADEVTNAKNRLTEAKDKVSSLEKDIAAQRQEIKQVEQAYQSALNQVLRLSSERQSEILTLINKRKEELTNVAGQLEQARKQKDGESIKAPVAGTIYKIKATKGPVQSGEELLSIVPEGEEMLLEVKVLNRDIGFIRQNMKAKVKLATFPFQEFGIVDGEVMQISPNAVVDKDLGLIFPTQIKLSKHSINFRGQDVEFTPGMAANAEIVTRKKSVLTFIVEPITRRFSEAFSVR
ncbi:HlyD family efflux transporter periplasmic adaptor subunit [Anabaena cylindrica FACHB-243]|uniref:Secretion protein HlyD family protein n=1 Tax=Anabaena cylindrica (strain ATCC 27899 / PCC 7122) TaxID=272123 RepID=K9ZLH7_ANACC|nr:MULTISPECIES: HlyD family efflux transporter periplasmic adaptor subunit [Anabaena]AFZ60103.1 secretion protein HlyD family protein [Anabaena cylindrica PCC 7122]MBD2417841.1 HlyD family efflux transporter periplasmic adaptor subunit [Anabaena cylindrica FACHB-243]MBY5283738.1 HlyD family efflux transporter periplasmic adaptor subunit [Anabaena sp. CCAP 1446/1C]MBY5308931.1 HlyD family efflux transporter periplasmic adaptor subunit [Anabaena sp. CCAP 1446/1C]MCM2404756.1 HlyD family efflux 